MTIRISTRSYDFYALTLGWVKKMHTLGWLPLMSHLQSELTQSKAFHLVNVNSLFYFMCMSKSQESFGLSILLNFLLVSLLLGNKLWQKHQQTVMHLGVGVWQVWIKKLCPCSSSVLISHIWKYTNVEFMVWLVV